MNLVFKCPFISLMISLPTVPIKEKGRSMNTNLPPSYPERPWTGRSTKAVTFFT
jgi:hypothetical protein